VKKLRSLVIGLAILLMVLLGGCGGSSKSSGGYADGDSKSVDLSEITWEGTGFNPEVPGETVASSGSARQSVQLNMAENAVVPSSRKLIKQAELHIEADQSLINEEGKLFGVNQKVDELIRKYEAYSEQTRSDENSARFTIRVPQIYYESLIAGAGVLGKINSRSETAEDVTIKYYDLEGRLNTRKALLVTYQGYLSRARDIDDIMKVEARIADLQNEIDRMGNQFTQLANLIDYATIELYIYNYSYTPSNTFKDSVGSIFKSFRNFASGALLVVLAIVVYGTPITIFCLLAFWLLFGRVGILKKSFRFVLHDSNVKKDSNVSEDG
jgi:hypothetical protein